MLVTVAFKRHLQNFLGIKCFIRQFLASQDLIVDMIFEWLEFLVELQTEKNRKSNTKNRKIPKKKPKNTEKTEKTEKNRKNRTLLRISNLGLVFFGYFGLQPPQFTPWSMVKKVDHDHDTLDFAHGQWPN